MSTLGNILWFLLGGCLMGLAYIVWGLLYCLTVVGIPFGFQLIKIGLFAMFPFGQAPQFPQESMGCLSLVFNVIWIVGGGIELAIGHLVLGALFCITVIGIPFGMQHFKLARLALMPFSQQVN